MSHIIQPVSINGSSSCVSCTPVILDSRKHTAGVLTTDYTSSNEAVLTSACGLWTLLDSTAEGEVSFGVSCGSQADIELESSSIQGVEMTVYFYVDGVEVDSVVMSESNEFDTRSITFTGGACGSVITIFAESTLGDVVEAFVTALVINIS